MRASVGESWKFWANGVLLPFEAGGRSKSKHLTPLGTLAVISCAGAVRNQYNLSPTPALGKCHSERPPERNQHDRIVLVLGLPLNLELCTRARLTGGRTIRPIPGTRSQEWFPRPLIFPSAPPDMKFCEGALLKLPRVTSVRCVGSTHRNLRLGIIFAE